MSLVTMRFFSFFKVMIIFYNMWLLKWVFIYLSSYYFYKEIELSWTEFECFQISSVLRIEPRATHMLGKCSTIELYSQPLIFKIIILELERKFNG